MEQFGTAMLFIVAKQCFSCIFKQVMLDATLRLMGAYVIPGLIQRMLFSWVFYARMPGLVKGGSPWLFVILVFQMRPSRCASRG
jgi:hypothetical protein